MNTPYTNIQMVLILAGPCVAPHKQMYLFNYISQSTRPEQSLIQSTAHTYIDSQASHKQLMRVCVHICEYFTRESRIFHACLERAIGSAAHNTHGSISVKVCQTFGFEQVVANEFVYARLIESALPVNTGFWTISGGVSRGGELEEF